MIRGLVAADAAAAAALIRAAFAVQAVATDPPSSALRETADSVAAQIAAGGGTCVERGGAIAAAVLWREQEGGLYVGRLAVDPAFRRQGLARTLLGAAEAEARRRGLTRMRLGVRVPLVGNRRMFADCGFVEVGFGSHEGYAAPTTVQMEKRLG